MHVKVCPPLTHTLNFDLFFYHFTRWRQIWNPICENCTAGYNENSRGKKEKIFALQLHIYFRGLPFSVTHSHLIFIHAKISQVSNLDIFQSIDRDWQEQVTFLLCRFSRIISIYSFLPNACVTCIFNQKPCFYGEYVEFCCLESRPSRLGLDV